MRNLEQRILELSMIMNHNVYDDSTGSCTIAERIRSDVNQIDDYIKCYTNYREHVKEAITIDEEFEKSISLYVQDAIDRALKDYDINLPDETELAIMRKYNIPPNSPDPQITDFNSRLKNELNEHYIAYFKDGDTHGLNITFDVDDAQTSRVSGSVAQKIPGNFKDLKMDIYIPRESVKLIFDPKNAKNAIRYLKHSVSQAVVHEFVHVQQILRSKEISRNEKIDPTYRKRDAGLLDTKMTVKVEVSAHAKQAAKEFFEDGHSPTYNTYMSASEAPSSKLVRREFLEQFSTQLSRYKASKKHIYQVLTNAFGYKIKNKLIKTLGTKLMPGINIASTIYDIVGLLTDPTAKAVIKMFIDHTQSKVITMDRIFSLLQKLKKKGA